MLESVQIDLAVSECIVRGNVVRELYELKVDALVSQLFLGRGPQILVDAADYAELYGYGIAGIAVGCLCIIGSCAARAAAGGQNRARVAADRDSAMILLSFILGASIIVK